jgi:tetratricopeptide (TPR) repeat protein/predicted Ser/Thr protein kinase
LTKCPRCAAANAETQRFCGDCGTPLPTTPRPGPPVKIVDETIPLPTTQLEPGMLFAHRYQVVEELGAGGMGSVFRVHDEKINEEIALKLIQPEVASDRQALERFSSELKLARQVVHRNVARMFDLNEDAGVPYITMEYVRGENLKRLIRKVGHLSPGQAIPIACEICAGLEEAHRQGIVHRDLKPQNIMIDENGQAKILDFGLARLRSGGTVDRRSSRSGTPAYVSPEQARGLAADERSDLYSLGVVLYEMLTGRTPFQAENLHDLIDMHLNEPPRDPRELNPGLSAELSSIVMKCLEKDPAARYQTAEELKQALGCLTESPGIRKKRVVRRALVIAAGTGLLAAAAILVFVIIPREPWKPSVAVLPIEDTGSQEAGARFLAGLQREITDRLYTLPSLRVAQELVVNSYDFQGKSPSQIGKTLNVGYLVKVTVAVEGNTVSGKYYLINTRRNEPAPPMNFSKDLVSYRALQDEIPTRIAKALGVDLAPENLKKFHRRGTDNIEAYSLFLEGMSILNQETNARDVERAIRTLQQAVQIDPNYALGHWALGYAYENLYYDQEKGKNPGDLAEMYEHLNRASQIDPTFAETNLGLGWYFFNKADNARAFGYFQKALKLEPDSALIIRDAGAFLRSLGLYDQALPFLTRAAKLNPRDQLTLTQIAQCWLFLGHCEKALPFTKKALDLRESDPDANFLHTVILTLTGRYDEADRQIKAMERFDFRNDRLPFLKEAVSALRQGRGKRYDFIAGGPSLTPQGTYLYISFAMIDEALGNIKKGIDAGFWNGMYLYSYPSLVKNPRYKALRADPRFQEILKRQKELYEKAFKPFEKL